MLKTMNQNQAQHSLKGETGYHFEWTNVWDTAFHEHRQVFAKAKSFSDDNRKVLDQLRLDPHQYERYRDKALLSWICNNQAGTPERDIDVKTELKQFRADNQLGSRSELLDYMARADLDESQLTTLLQDVTRVNQIRQAAGDLRSGIINQLKLDGGYSCLLEIANLKQKVIESAGVDVEHPGVLPPQILAWYFGQQLGDSIPQRLEEHLNRIDLDSSDDFNRLISAEYVYWRENS
jgi:hypothetical protein